MVPSATVKLDLANRRSQLTAVEVDALASDVEASLAMLRADGLRATLGREIRKAASKSSAIEIGALVVSVVGGASYLRSPEQTKKLLKLLWQALRKAFGPRTTYDMTISDGQRTVALKIVAADEVAILEILDHAGAEVAGKFPRLQSSHSDPDPIRIEISPHDG